MAMGVTVRNAMKLMEEPMKGNDASHDIAHVRRVRDLALSLAHEEGLSYNPDSMEIAELAALLHDIGDYKYMSDPSEQKIVEKFLDKEGIAEGKRIKILKIYHKGNGDYIRVKNTFRVNACIYCNKVKFLTRIQRECFRVYAARLIPILGFKDELAGLANGQYSPEFGVVQDADRLDAIGAIGIACCFTFVGSRNRELHDPAIQPQSGLSKEQYMKKDRQTTVNHFHEKLLKLKDMMKTKAGQRRAEKRHKIMVEFLKEFYEEWDGRA